MHVLCDWVVCKAIRPYVLQQQQGRASCTGVWRLHTARGFLLNHTAASLLWVRQARKLLGLHCLCSRPAPQILVFSIIYLQPLQRSWSYWAYSKLMIMLVVSQALKVHTAHGLPQSWSLDAIKAWLMRVMPTSDMQYFLLAFAAAPNRPVTALLPPFMVLAAYNLAAFLSEACAGQPLWQQHGAPLYRKMQAKQQQALAFVAQAEIMLGFTMLVGLLLPGRAPMFTFMTWQFLRMRYWSADAALYHRQVGGGWVAGGWQADDDIAGDSG